MQYVLEKLIICCSPKTAKYNNLRCKESNLALLNVELYAALTNVAKEHKLGVLLIQAQHLYDTESEQLLRQYIHIKCANMNIDCPDIISMIIAAMILEIPLITQHKKMKSLYRRYGQIAATRRNNIDKLNKEINATNPPHGPYRLNSLMEQRDHELSHLDEYAEHMSKVTNHCPKCSGQYREISCDLCLSTGKIKIKMADAIEFFMLLGIPFNSATFMDDYWSKIITLLDELNKQKNEAMTAMSVKLKEESD